MGDPSGRLLTVNRDRPGFDQPGSRADPHRPLVNTRSAGVPSGAFWITPLEALSVSQVISSADATSPLALLYSAATPAMCGLAIEVPLMVFSPPSSQADVMSTPGA